MRGDEAELSVEGRQVGPDELELRVEQQDDLTSGIAVLDHPPAPM